MTIAAAIPIIATTIMTSINVNPACRDRVPSRLVLLDTPIAGRQLSNWHADNFAWSRRFNSLILNIFLDLFEGANQADVGSRSTICVTAGTHFVPSDHQIDQPLRGGASNGSSLEGSVRGPLIGCRLDLWPRSTFRRARTDPVMKASMAIYAVEPHDITAVVPLVSSVELAEACPRSPRYRRTPAAHFSTA